MIVIYDFDQTMATDDTISYVRVEGRLVPLNLLRMKAFFADMVDRHGRYGAYEEKVRTDEGVRGRLLEELGKIATVPTAQLPDHDDIETLLTWMRFLFNVNQRQVKRELCDMLLHGDDPANHGHVEYPSSH